ncbi:hypothetical protein F5Y17DRAFT_431037 [Xylariaceae sp. FL0594]|nr:hypothetical protein F5Y17DRAFT_431037 [Xylariaceae sp. FL0594]
MAAVDVKEATTADSAIPIYLIPWDPDSEDHVERMKRQRIACGWKVEQVESWREPQRKGDSGLYWVVLHPNHPLTPSRLEKHFAAYPDESSPLLDTCKFILGRRSRADHDSPLKSFHPVGHVSLDAVTRDPEMRTSMAGGVLSLMNFYVSRALQNMGLGGAVMTEVERIAKQDFGAKAITLYTIAHEECLPDTPRRIALKKPAPKISNQEWYTRRGYKVYGRNDAAWTDVDDTGREWPTRAVYMRKELA